MGAMHADQTIPYEELELSMPTNSDGWVLAGEVYRGKWFDVDIAAKDFRACHGELPASEVQDALLKEAGLMANCTHPNLVRLCGACLDPPLLVTEYYRNGRLSDLLSRARDAIVARDTHGTNKSLSHLSWKRRLRMLHDVACGMLYLHSRSYVHGNLRSRSLYVTENDRVKIGDFGFMQRLEPSEEVIRVEEIAHPRWVAPEVLMDSSLSTASDVYSFGIVMYELLTFKVPLEDLPKPEVAIKVLTSAARPKIPTFGELPPNTSRICLKNYITLMQECWQQDPTQRPSFSTVAHRLKAMQHWLLACDSVLQGSTTAVQQPDEH